MNKMNMIKIRDTTKELNNENKFLEWVYMSTICSKCKNPATYILVRGFADKYHEDRLCNTCSNYIKKLSDFEWDLNEIVGVYKLM